VRLATRAWQAVVVPGRQRLAARAWPAPWSLPRLVATVQPGVELLLAVKNHRPAGRREL
jgi:hypothetical protein